MEKGVVYFKFISIFFQVRVSQSFSKNIQSPDWVSSQRSVGHEGTTSTIPRNSTDTCNCAMSNRRRLVAFPPDDRSWAIDAKSFHAEEIWTSCGTSTCRQSTIFLDRFLQSCIAVCANLYFSSLDGDNSCSWSENTSSLPLFQHCDQCTTHLHNPLVCLTPNTGMWVCVCVCVCVRC
jgi:hypothetical protein